jgi:2Fe-2S ferredoxin
MPEVVFVQPNGKREAVEAASGMSVMQAAVDCDIAGIIGACGGNCSCGTCHVYVDEQWLARLPKPSREEVDRLDEVAAVVKRNSRIGCQVVLTARLDGLVVYIPPTQG